MAQVDWTPVTDWTGAVLGRVELWDEVDSTNAECLRRPPAAPDERPLVLVGRHQTRGRGRRGRSWHAAPDQSFLCTIGLARRPRGIPIPCLPLLGAVAVCDTVQRLEAGSARCKWPNDVLLKDRKLAGVLVEVQSEGAGNRIVLGVGLNVAQQSTDFVGGFDTPPTSLRAEGYPGSTAAAGAALLDALDQRLAQARAKGPSPLIESWLANLLGPSGRVQVAVDSRVLEGRLVGFEPSGEILLETAPGRSPQRLAGGHVQSLRAREDLPAR